MINEDIPSTLFSDAETLILQISAHQEMGGININGKVAQKTAAHIFIPDKKGTISCPLTYFQENASLPQKWIKNDSGHQYSLNYIDKLKKVCVTQKSLGSEKKTELPDKLELKLIEYFSLDICHNFKRYSGFDCYAFVCLLVNVKYIPEKPHFNYFSGSPEIGDVIVLTSGNILPDSIKHWAVYLGNSQYLSKFGKSGEGAQSLIEVTNLNAMMSLYNC